MARSYVNYTGNGATRDYTFSFPYLNLLHLHVFVQGLEQTPNVDFTFTGTSSIQFSVAPLEGELITIRRLTSLDARLVNFTNGSILDESTQNTDSKQAFYLVQEAYDILNLAGEDGSAAFTSRDSILSALTGWIDESHLAQTLAGPLSYLTNQWAWAELFDPSTLDVYEEGTYTDKLAEDHAYIQVMDDRIDAVVADTDGNTALLSLLSSEFFVKLDNNGNVAGFGLYNGEVSEFIVNVDKFAVIKSDGTGTKTPFVIDVASGNIGIDGNLIVTGSVTAGKLAADSVVASNINVSNLAAINADLGTITAGIIRSTNWGTSAGSELLLSNGTFKYGGSAAPALEWDGSDLNISTGGDVTIDLGGNLTLKGSDTVPGKLVFDGASYDVTFGMSSSGANLTLEPNTDGAITFFMGLSGGNKFKALNFAVKESVTIQSADGSNSAASWATVGSGLSRVGFTTWRTGGVYREVTLWNSASDSRFIPEQDNLIQLGDSSNRWTAVYAVNGTIQTSDERDKECIVNTPLGLDFVNKLRPVNYKYIDVSLGGTRQGLIAQEVEEVLDGQPLSALHYDEKTDRYGINYAEFVPSLIKAVQELDAKVKRMEKNAHGKPAD